MTASKLYPELLEVVGALRDGFEEIPAARRELLEDFAGYVAEKRADDDPLRLIFICTHNSRRSHLAQVWAQVAAFHFGVARVETFSGGTEATAFAPPAIASLHRHGFRIEKAAGRDNPRVFVSFAADAPALTCFSKVYDEAPNPVRDFAAVMVCSSADEACPVVVGAERRFALPFEDPKVSDGTDAEAATYDERTREIGREMLYVFARAVRSD